MAIHRRRIQQGSVVPVTAPSFIAIVSAQALEDGKLEIPRAVVRQSGDLLAEMILLKVPKGANWVIELTKSNGKIWLQKGWPEFARHYSLEHGSLLLFSFQGDYSCLRVQIFKRNTMEINYPPLEMNYPPNSSITVEMNHASSHDDGPDPFSDNDGPDADDENGDNDDADDGGAHDGI
ncbi:PREDICTED: B3 domain-containing protein At3g18960-like [Fragaria vesca subsp. vesca]|uniref:B3 domain-containing protein At3g18960-like n=1 Tax=Fragaria vesca subsp. vesca TaxID=101020 RepID=UPI0002C2DDD1|nr:PREDICTED: B3 domain-containing protein At3g18960-like [Fragaria vesca subsp. vesca]